MIEFIAALTCCEASKNSCLRSLPVTRMPSAPTQEHLEQDRNDDVHRLLPDLLDTYGLNVYASSHTAKKDKTRRNENPPDLLDTCSSHKHAAKQRRKEHKVTKTSWKERTKSDPDLLIISTPAARTKIPQKWSKERRKESETCPWSSIPAPCTNIPHTWRNKRTQESPDFFLICSGRQDILYSQKRKQTSRKILDFSCMHNTKSALFKGREQRIKSASQGEWVQKYRICVTKSGKAKYKIFFSKRRRAYTRII